MSAPFTAISAETDLQDIALYHEILRAEFERLSAFKGSAVSFPDSLFDIWPVGLDIQNHAIYLEQQVWLEGALNAEGHMKVLDYETSWSGLTDLPWLSLARWRELAGLHPSGFRRVPGAAWPSDWTDANDPAYSYGRIEPGDIIGPWLLTDLQRGYSALRWTALEAQVPSSATGISLDHLGYASRLWSSWAAMVADPVFPGPAGGGGLYLPMRYVDHLAPGASVTGYWTRARFNANPWSARNRRLRLVMRPFSWDWVLDGLGDYVFAGRSLLTVHDTGPHDDPASWDTPSSISFTPPSDPKVPGAGYLDSNFYWVCEYDFTNA